MGQSGQVKDEESFHLTDEMLNGATSQEEAKLCELSKSRCCEHSFRDSSVQELSTLSLRLIPSSAFTVG